MKINKKVLVIGTVILLCIIIMVIVVIKTNLNIENIEASSTVTKIENTPTVSYTYTPLPTQEIATEVIDYDSIPGLTEGNVYPTRLVEDNTKNILIIGEDKVAGLYDTIGIMNIDKKNKKIKVIMIPRDTYIQYNKKVVHYMENAGKSGLASFYKINCAHNIGPIMKYKGKFSQYSMSFLADVVKEVFGIEVDDYVKVNTEGFVSIVDLFGGVDIDVPYNMDYDDPFQDLSIHLKKGLQHLDGKQAEGFVRFRQGYDEKNVLKSYGDTERKKNQIAFIKAFISQHATLENITKIPGLIKNMNKNVKTSVGVGDVLMSYMGTFNDIVINKYKIESMTIQGKGELRNGTYYQIIN